MPSRIREEAGIGLIELLVAMLVLSVGIFALVAGFSSGFGSINRASKTSTAGTLADQQMEAFRRGGWDAVVSIAGAPKPGADGRMYWMQTVVDYPVCPDEITTPSGSPPTCTLSDGVKSRPVKRTTVTVREDSGTSPPDASGKLLITESSTFDQSIG